MSERQDLKHAINIEIIKNEINKHLTKTKKINDSQKQKEENERWLKKWQVYLKKEEKLHPILSNKTKKLAKKMAKESIDRLG
jgi:hypothetical protein